MTTIEGLESYHGFPRPKIVAWQLQSGGTVPTKAKAIFVITFENHYISLLTMIAPF